MKLHSFFKVALSVGLALMLGCGDSSSDNNDVPPPSQGGGTQIAPFGAYVMTNAPINNTILTYIRTADGALTFSDEFTTGGNGDGTDLEGGQGSLVFQDGTNRFYCVNAGSDTVSALILGVDGGLAPVSTVTSNGARPISVTYTNDLVYVLNYGDVNTNQPANITGFRFVGSSLIPIPNSTQTLSVDHPDACQIAFHTTGTVLVVTERGTDNIITYVVDSNGVAQPGISQGSNGDDPAGIDFTPNGLLVVSEGNNANIGAGSSSVYIVAQNGSLVDTSISVGNNQTGTHGVKVYGNAPYVFYTNTESDTVSSYTLDGQGILTLNAGDAGNTGDAPRDIKVSADSQYLYTLDGGSDALSTFRINANGSLTDLNMGPTLPATSVGLVVR